MKRNFNKEKYNQRNLVETVNSVIKRLMDDSVKSRKVRTQNREMVLDFILPSSLSLRMEFKMLAYNAHRQAMNMGS